MARTPASELAPLAPGAWVPLREVWGSVDSFRDRFPERALVLVDARVARLHPAVRSLLRAGRPLVTLTLRAGERAKSVAGLARVLARATSIPRSGTLVCIGGGTLGDLATVAAHLHKRGIRLIQVPSTLLAAVDSSVGGKGALHVGSGDLHLKNAAGVFHYAAETWICPELYQTLSGKQRREGAIEAWKMVACVDERLWERWCSRRPSLRELIVRSRALKAAVCAEDPYEQTALRSVLNFGHTFGHALESVSRFRLSHGEAVGLGILCALDVGRVLGVTEVDVARDVERAFSQEVGAMGREGLAWWLRRASAASIGKFLQADKKAGGGGELRMVLLRQPGGAVVNQVPGAVWRRLFGSWKRGRTP